VLGALSMNIFLPSLPQMTAYFETDYRLMQLSVALYLAVNADAADRDRPDLGPLRAQARSCLWGSPCSCWQRWAASIAPNIEVFLFFRMLQAVVVTGLVLGPRGGARHVSRRTRPPARSAMSPWAWPWCR
jgi:DHA1 family bicyclomycin/chloramphenicol resistance-like MFS transporter